MKLPIKKKYFDMIKNGTKDFELRDSHITFVCEETGEIIIKEVINVAMVQNDGLYPEVCKDKWLIEFTLD